MLRTNGMKKITKKNGKVAKEDRESRKRRAR